MEKISDYNAVSFDIESFFDSNSSKVALDEAQRLPEIFSALRSVVDKNRKNGRYVLTGSASPSLLKGVIDSLAGRIGILELTPFGISELQGIYQP
ncbi:MAG: AAA family ATPase [Elusimicrobia bacterium]|nr:AAA family ATPase [Elusimicrobiota bacterium]